MKILVLLQFPQQLEQFKCFLRKLDDVEITVITDTRPAYSNMDRWYREGAWKNKIRILNSPVFPHPWYYVLGRNIDDARFFYWKLKTQSEYYKKRATAPWPAFLPLAWLKKFYKPHKAIRQDFAKLNPDLVITSSLAFRPLHVDQDFALEAKRRGVPVWSFINNWDALTTKAAMYPMPDRVFCWNVFQENELIKYHGVAPEKIMKVGAFSFERWLEPRRATPRREFCKKWGLDEMRPIITYLSSSNSIAGDEIDGVTQFAGYATGRREQVVVRAHPDKADKLAQIKGVTCIPKAGENPTDEEATQLAWDTYYHSKEIYGINTSAMIDAMLVGRPVFGININRVEVTTKCLHYQQLEPYLDGEGYKVIRKWLGIGDRLPSDLIAEAIKCYNK